MKPWPDTRATHANATAPIGIPQALAVTGEIPKALFLRDAILPSENRYVPTAAHAMPIRLSISLCRNRSCQNSRTSPQAPKRPPQRRTLRMRRQTAGAFTALNTDSREKMTETRPEEISAVAV